MFRPIIRFSSESMVVVLYRIGMVMSQWWDLIICDALLYSIVKGHRGAGGGLSVMCAILGCMAQVCLLAAVLCGSPAIVHFQCLLLVGFCYRLCVHSNCGDLCVQPVLLCACTCLPSRGLCAFYFISVVFGGSVTGAQTCLVIVAWHCVGNCRLALCW